MFIGLNFSSTFIVMWTQMLRPQNWHWSAIIGFDVWALAAVISVVGFGIYARLLNIRQMCPSMLNLLRFYTGTFVEGDRTNIDLSHHSFNYMLCVCHIIPCLLVSLALDIWSAAELGQQPTTEELSAQRGELIFCVGKAVKSYTIYQALVNSLYGTNHVLSRETFYIFLNVHLSYMRSARVMVRKRNHSESSPSSAGFSSGVGEMLILCWPSDWRNCVVRRLVLPPPYHPPT